MAASTVAFLAPPYAFIGPFNLQAVRLYAASASVPPGAQACTDIGAGRLIGHGEIERLAR